MRKKKKLLNLALLLSLGVGSFGPNVSAVFAEEPADEIVLESNESQTTEGSNENTEDELELEIPDSEESSKSINLDSAESENEIQETIEIVETKSTDENEMGSSEQLTFYSDSDFEIENGVLKKYCGKATTVKIPSSVKSIGKKAFYCNTSVENVIIPNSVTSIGESAFKFCHNLENITIGNGVKVIPDEFAVGCYRLKTVILNGKVEEIDEFAFFDCKSLTSINLPNSLKTIELGAFSGTGLVNGIIPDSVTELEGSIFDSCENLQTVNTGNGVTAIPGSFCSNCPNLSKVIVGNRITSIGSSAFYNCTSLTSISLPDKITYIGSWAFKKCKSLQTVKLPKELKSIQFDSFNKTNLNSLTIPDKVTRIGSNAFSNIKNLTDINLSKSISSIASDAFSGSSNICLHIYSDHQYAIDYATNNNIIWKYRPQASIAKPKTVKAESVGKNKIRLSWSKVSGAEKYLVQCWRNGKLQYKYTTKNNYLTDPKASDTASNTYKVYSRKTRPDGTIAYSSQPAVVSALGICPRVTNVRANSTKSGAQIKWNKSYYNDGYIIYRSVNKNGTDAVFAGTTRDVKFTDKKAKKGQLYYYWVYPYHYQNGKMILGEKPAESPRAKMK